MEDTKASTIGERLRLLLDLVLVLTTILSVIAAIVFFSLTAMVAPPDQIAGVQWAGLAPNFGMIAAAVAFISELFRRLFVRKPRKWLPLAIMLGLAAAYGAPFLITNSEQDDCTFGPVSNEQYRDYLRRAKDLSSKTPGSFSLHQDRASARFNELFERLVDQKPSVYERVAASHALLRSFGAQYRNTSGMPDTYARVAKTGGVVGFNYYLDANRLGLFHPFLLFMRQAWIITDLTGPGDFYRGPVPTVAGDIRFVVNYPAFDGRPPIDRAPEQCPPVPDPTLSESFSRIAR